MQQCLCICDKNKVLHICYSGCNYPHFLFYLFIAGHREVGANPSRQQARGGVTLDRLPIHQRANTETSNPTYIHTYGQFSHFRLWKEVLQTGVQLWTMEGNQNTQRKPMHSQEKHAYHQIQDPSCCGVMTVLTTPPYRLVLWTVH